MHWLDRIRHEESERKSELERLVLRLAGAVAMLVDPDPARFDAHPAHVTEMDVPSADQLLGVLGELSARVYVGPSAQLHPRSAELVNNLLEAQRLLEGRPTLRGKP